MYRFNGDYLFRITHINNILLFLQCGFLYSQNSAPQDFAANYSNIYNEDIHKGRGRRCDPAHPGLTVHHYVPFYFCYKSPMLYAVKFYHNQDNIAYIVIKTANILQAGIKYAFTDSNAFLATAMWFHDIKDLGQLDWEAINAQQWGSNSDPSGNTKHYKMAEFLILDKLPWGLISSIVVKSNVARDKVLRMIDNYKYREPVDVLVCPNWFF